MGSSVFLERLQLEQSFLQVTQERVLNQVQEMNSHQQERKRIAQDFLKSSEDFSKQQRSVAKTQTLSTFFTSLYQLGGIDIHASSAKWITQGLFLLSHADKNFLDGKYLHTRIEDFSQWLSQKILGSSQEWESTRDIFAKGFTLVVENIPTLLIALSGQSQTQSLFQDWIKQALFWTATCSDVSRLYYDYAKTVNEKTIRELQEKLSALQESTKTMNSQQKELVANLQKIINHIARIQAEDKQLSRTLIKALKI